MPLVVNVAAKVGSVYAMALSAFFAAIRSLVAVLISLMIACSTDAIYVSRDVLSAVVVVSA